MSGKVIMFPQNNESLEPGINKVKINLNMDKKQLEKALDELWMEIHTDQQIQEMDADLDGNINFIFKQGRYLPKYSYDNAFDHISFMLDFINESNVAGEFLDEYEKFIDGHDDKAIFAIKKSPTSRQED